MILNDFLFSFNVVAPVFVILFIGFFTGRKGILDPETIRKLNWIVFNLALPMLLFRDIAASDFTTVFDFRLILFSVAGTLAAFAAGWLAASRLVEKSEAGAFTQGCFRGNYALIGIPIIANIMGEAYTGKAALIATFIIPLYNVLAIICLIAGAQAEDVKKGGQLKQALAGIAKNPLIIGIVLGLPFSFFRLSLPSFLSSSLNSMAAISTPLALLAIGASISLKNAKGKFKSACIASSIKLIAIPALVIPLAAAIGFRGENIAIIYVTFAAPTAVSSYIMADRMRNDGPLAASIVAITMLCSVATFTIGVFMLKSLGLLL
ncbi:MAG: AEC family transporter [Clostridiales bacterium]|jgi:predicted permease|nr:AEC family transporter [Clostridiales bacterium]